MTRKIAGHYIFQDWNMLDPDDATLHEAMANLAIDGDLSKSHKDRLLSACQAFVHLAGHVAPTAMIAKQLRQIRAAVKADRKARP